MAVLTPEEEGGYSVEVPDLPGCFTCGDDLMEAIEMAADAAKTYVASLLRHGEQVPATTSRAVPEGCESAYVFFETDGDYVVPGEVVSAAEAARMLGLSAARVTHLIDSGALQGYRRGRRTYVSRESVDARMGAEHRAGRPRKTAMA